MWDFDVTQTENGSNPNKVAFAILPKQGATLVTLKFAVILLNAKVTLGEFTFSLAMLGVKK